jgi:hypothetical protein
MDEIDIKTILEEPLPQKGPAKKSKKGGRKKTKKEEEKQNNESNESNENQMNQPENQMNQPENQMNQPEDILVPINLSFLIFIRNLLTDIVPRTKWRAEEMAPVGMALNNLSATIEEVMNGPMPGDPEEE